MGIYVHIPFCRSKCYYCGFYSVASIQLKQAYIEALKREIALRCDYLGAGEVRTLYFGGGTPSWLSVEELTAIMRCLENNFRLENTVERTIEVNPEDITSEKLNAWKDLSFNRLSIGIQSFNNTVLKQINRTHSGRQAIQAVELAAEKGFGNIGIDLIIGLPGYTIGQLKEDIGIIDRLPICHLSVYMLSIDSNTVFEKLWEKGKFDLPADEEVAEQYLWVSDYLKSIGFEHYEISNFAKKSRYAVHNTSYWQQKKYVGFGTAAHSFDQESRQWNVAHLKSYIEALSKGELNFEKEVLTDKDRYNEYIMTNLRTMWGIREEELTRQFPGYWKISHAKLAPYIEKDLIRTEKGRLSLTEKGWLVSDDLFSELFV